MEPPRIYDPAHRPDPYPLCTAMPLTYGPSASLRGLQELWIVAGAS